MALYRVFLKMVHPPESDVSSHVPYPTSDCKPRILPVCVPSQRLETAPHLQVYLPSALTGGSTSSDPKIREVNNELNEVNRKILNNDLQIPPEGERSPSPEPIYDRNGE